MSISPARTNGFLFADLRDYTRYVEAHGDRAAATLLEAYRSLVRAAVAEHGGAEIKTEGDSFYVVFPSASGAVECGLAILRAAAEGRAAGGPPISVGIGVHAGETVETAEGYVGSAVNVAARVCSRARAGELLVTDTVRALTRTFLRVRFTDRRTRRLKGIAEPMVLYRVEPLAEGAVAEAPRRRFPGTLPSPSGLGRTARVGMLLAGLLIGGAAAGYLLVASLRPPASSPEPGSSDGIGLDSSPSAAASAAFPNPAEADLLAQLPVELRDECRRTGLASERIGIVASLRCDLQLAADADTVWYDSFGSLQELSTALLEVSEAQSLARGDCGPDVLRAQGNWQVGSTHSGRLLCYQADGSSWIVWSYDAERIAARAVRSGDTAEDWQGLFEWWRQVRLFLH
jgi:class 3 adenylate cyclase